MPTEFRRVPIPDSPHSIHCAVDDGSGPSAPWLVFSNSLMTALDLWDDQVAAFRDRFRVLRYDQRGHGLTAVPDEACTVEALSGDLLALFDAFAIRSAALVGVSLGGITALAFAIRHPDRLTHLAVSDAPAAAAPGAGRLWDERVALARQAGMAALVEPTVSRWFAPASREGGHPAVTRVAAMIGGTPVEGFARAASALRAYDLAPGLGTLTVPALFLAGALDGALPEAMRAMAGSAPRARFVEIEGAGHLPNIERPAAFNAVLADVLAP